MKASELIKELLECITDCGDQEVYFESSVLKHTCFSSIRHSCYCSAEETLFYLDSHISLREQYNKKTKTQEITGFVLRGDEL